MANRFSSSHVVDRVHRGLDHEIQVWVPRPVFRRISRFVRERLGRRAQGIFNAVFGAAGLAMAGFFKAILNFFLKAFK